VLFCVFSELFWAGDWRWYYCYHGTSFQFHALVCLVFYTNMFGLYTWVDKNVWLCCFFFSSFNTLQTYTMYIETCGFRHGQTVRSTPMTNQNSQTAHGCKKQSVLDTWASISFKSLTFGPNFVWKWTKSFQLSPLIPICHPTPLGDPHYRLVLQICRSLPSSLANPGSATDYVRRWNLVLQISSLAESLITLLQEILLIVTVRYFLDYFSRSAFLFFLFIP